MALALATLAACGGAAAPASPPIAVAVSPRTAATELDGFVQFAAATANVAAGLPTGVAWSVRETGGGAIDSAGLYEAPGVVGTFTVVATSLADATRSGTASVAVTSSGELGTAQKIALVAGKRWVFYHMSTGCNVMGGAWSGAPTNQLVHDMVYSSSSPVGLYKAVRDAGGGLNVVHPWFMGNVDAFPDDDPRDVTNGQGAGTFSAGTLWHNHVIAANESVSNKIAAFDRHLRAYLGAPGSAQALARVAPDRPIHAGVKFCWVDDWTADIVTRLFETYRSTMAKLEADYPGVHVLHFAAPLQPLDATRNGYRTTWSDRLRATYPGLVFDTDLAESTRADGSEYRYGGQRALAPEWSGDSPNGHLSEAGSNWMGERLLDFLARVAAR